MVGENGLAAENTQQAILPLIVTLFVTSFIGWSLGISKIVVILILNENMDQIN